MTATPPASFATFQRLDGPACAFMRLHCYRNALPASQSAVMVEGIRAVDEILEMAAHIVIIRGRTDDEHIAVEHFVDYFSPVVVLDDAGLLFLAFFAAQAGVDLLPCKRDKFRFYTCTLAAFENDVDQICSVAFLTHAS